MRVAIIVTVLNEANSLPDLLESMAIQTRPADEIVICDGGSTDATVAILESEERLPLRVIRKPGVGISAGRNTAIDATSSDVIAVTDAGVRLDHEWLARIIEPFDDEAVWVVSGFFRPDPHSVFEVAMGATVLPELGDIVPSRFLPSSRSVAFRKTAWAEVGGYPEWLDYCEDLIFDLRLRKRYGDFAFAPAATVFFRPRTTLKAFFVQYYRYARGDGKADLWRLRHAARYLTYCVAVPAVAFGGLLINPWIWLLSLIGIPGMFLTGWRRLFNSWDNLSSIAKAQAFLWAPIIRITGDVAKMLGYPVGWVWRWRHREQIPNWRQN
ncbi:MAG: glycosyltransferase [Chloroflexi bacterium]|nr:glycosyltransferase [Chloroflexota bacterium]